MRSFQPLIICDDEEPQVSSMPEFAALNNSPVDSFGFEPEQVLESIVFQIIKKPTVLTAHLQRVFFCYQQNLSEDLFAALVDLLIVLEGKGADLSSRMVKGSKSKLPPRHYALLAQALKMSPEDVKLLPGNLYSLFSRGLIGTPVLVIKEEQKQQNEHDPLEIARDFIAYSQLEEAMDTLENAIFAEPDRHDLHNDLLELYRLTQSFERFKKMYGALSGQTNTIPAAWDELKGFFNEG